MNEGDIVLVPLPQADGKVKNRPALVLRQLPPFQDLLCCGISTQLRREVRGFDELIDIRDADFTASGLRTTSLVRLGFLAVLPLQSVVGTLGLVSPSRHRKLLQRLADYLTRSVG